MSAGNTQVPLGRLERVDVREVWESEATRFTPWLAQQENIALLGETVDLELEVEAQEKAVGPFRADILCKDGSGSWVLIENQLERSDHTHLGQLLTYAAGLDAVTIVWVSPKFADEHRATLDWLNKITDERFNFFGLEIEAWRIGNSPIAPKFNIVSKPNGWSRAVAQGVQAELRSETKQLQLEYWTAFKEVVNASKILRCQKPLPQHWMNLPIGRAGFVLVAIVNTIEKRLVVQLIIGHSDAKNHFNLLLKQKTDVEKEIGCNLRWLELPENKQSRIELWREHTDASDKQDWPNQHNWLIESLEAFYKAFSQRIKGLPYPESSSGQSVGATA